jgi:glycosyltransferase involved in cell wall biosynthesis
MPPNNDDVIERVRRPRPKVLHIGKIFGGGVMVAIADYIRSTTAQYDHVVLARPADQDDTGVNCRTRFLELPTGWFGIAAIRSIRKAVAAEAPDIVHLHSSWVGLWGRLGVPRRVPVAYSPHCYAFERTDISRNLRRTFWFAEWLLSRIRRTVIIAVSPRETELAVGLNPRQSVAYVPNVADITSSPGTSRTPTSCLSVVGAGRLVPQKGSDWFGEVAQAVRAKSGQVSFTWLGGGSADVEARLSRSGVQVTGWLPRAEVVKKMTSADVYMHSAAWEGAPLTALEAVSLRLPVLCRQIKSMTSLGFPLLFSRAEDAANWLIHASENRSMLSAHDDAFQSIADRHSVQCQVDQLIQAYRCTLQEFSHHEGAVARVT